MNYESNNSEIIIREICRVDEMLAVEALQQEVWGISEREIVSFMMFIPTLEVGGALLGAFDGGELVGFSYGFIGHEHGRVILHSDMLAVRASYRDHKIGYRLKLAQREHALAQGIDRITWTFDPLQSRNAYLNIVRLGAVVRKYKVNYYGNQSTSALHHGLDTDRLLAEWWVDSPRVRAIAEIDAILTGQAGEGDPERAQLSGGQLERGRGLVAGHASGLRRAGATVNPLGALIFSPNLTLENAPHPEYSSLYD